MSPMERRVLTALALIAIATCAFAQQQSSARAIYARWSPSVVRVDVQYAGEEGAMGTGFVFVDRNVVATCYHVVEGGKKIEITAEGKVLRPTRIACDISRDL